MLNGNGKVIYFMLFAVGVFFVPLWITLFLNATIISVVHKKYVHPLVFIQVILSSVLISTMDITGDLGNYEYLYLNIYSPNVVYEFYSEPLIIYIFKFFNILGFDFKTVIFIISLFVNLSLYFALLRNRNIDCLRFLGVLLIYPSYMQTQLYLFRQSISVLLFLIFISYRYYYAKFIVFILSVISHSISLFYFLIVFFKKFSKIDNINSKYIISVIVFSVFFPLSDDFISSFLNNFSGLSYALNRKLSFFLNDDTILSTLSLYSTVFLPLHFIAAYTLIGNKRIILKPHSFIFFSLYVVALFLRNYSLLPTRLAYPIFWLSIIYCPLVLHEQKIKLTTSIKFVFLCFSIFSLFKFLYINDFGINNLHFNQHELLNLNVFNYLQER